MARGFKQRRVDNQAIVGDAQPAFKAKIVFVFGRTIAQRRPRERADGLGAENPALPPAHHMADGHWGRIDDLAGSL